MQVKDLGEFGVIDLLNRMVVQERRENPPFAKGGWGDFNFKLLVDTGDDTAAWRTGQATELFTTDTVVEGVHFTRSTTPWPDLGWKSLAANVSDIAAMGGRPLYGLITLGLPPETEVADIKELYRGMLEAGNRYGVAIVGGDMVRSPVVFITVALTGLSEQQPMLRSTARPGDQVAVTGYVGSSAGGLELLLESAKKASSPAAEYLRQAHRRPQPDVSAGRALVEAGVITAMDVSDGLADDLSKLCVASGVSARLFTDQVPVHPYLREAFPERCLELALNGGEDYVLLFAAAPELMAQVMPQLPEGSSVVGEIISGRSGAVTLVDAAGQERELPRRGWDHFGQA